MDVGLNNRNYLHKILKNSYLEDIEWIVEATSEERFNLWQDYHNDPKYNWKEVSSGYSYELLELEISGNGKIPSEVLPVWVEFSFAIINGHKVCFYTSNSLLVHHGYIDSFLITYFQRTHDKYSRWNHTDSTNFHNCIGYLEDIDLEPRNTIFEKDNKYYIWDLPENKPKKEFNPSENVEDFIQDVADKMGVTRKEAIERIEKFSDELYKIKNK